MKICTGLKICSKCREFKDVSMFGKHSKERDGLRGVCKECRKKEAVGYYLKKDKQKHLLETLRSRAKNLNVPFDLEYEDLTPPENCPVFNVPLERIETYSKASKKFSPSVDRVVPELGYTKNNIQIISNLANIMKHDATKEQLVLFAEWVLKTYKE